MSTTISELTKSNSKSNNNINEDGTAVIYPKSFWQEHREAYLASGYNKSLYCRKQGLTYHRFLYWCRKFAKSDEKDVSGSNSFIPVKLKSAMSDAGCLCALEFGGGNKLLIHDQSVLLLLLPKLLR